MITLFSENKRGNWKPLAIVLGATLLIGLVLTLILSSISIDSTIPNPDNFITGSFLYSAVTGYIGSSLLDTLDVGITLFGFDVPIPVVNPLSFLGTTIQSWIIDQINTLTYLPNQIVIPFFIFFILGLVWSAVKLFLP